MFTSVKRSILVNKNGNSNDAVTLCITRLLVQGWGDDENIKCKRIHSFVDSEAIFCQHLLALMTILSYSYDKS